MFDLIFLIDLFINFITIVEQENGVIITDRKVIALKYLKSWFVIDMISSVPINIILFGQLSNTAISFKLIKLLKAITLYRLLTISKLIKVTRNNKFVEWCHSKVTLSNDYAELQRNFIRMLVLIHFTGCAWAIIGVIGFADER